MKLRINAKLRAAVIAAITAVGFTLTQAQATESGSLTLHVDSAPGWVLSTDTGSNSKQLYEYLDATFNDGGSMTFTMELTWDGGSCGYYQELLHVGQDGTGFYLSANGGTHLLVGPAADHSGSREVSTSLTAGQATQVTFTLTNKSIGTASASVTLGGQTYDVSADLTWNSMNWNSADEQKWKYSIGCGGPGWESKFPMDHFTITGNNITASYTAPAPVEALVWAGDATSSVWNTNAENQNWTKNTAAAAFVSESNVTFGSTADTKTVTLGEAITAGVVTVDGAAYEFAMAGKTLNATKLAVSGEGASLALTGEGTMTAGSIAASGKTISLDKDVVLTGSGSATLDGKGTYALTDGTYALGSIVLGENWTGTVRVTSASVNNLVFSTLTKGTASTLELKGYTGWSNQWKGGTNNENIKLTNPGGGAYAWTNRADTTTTGLATKFTGKWSGNGTFAVAPRALGYTFKGDISEWTGAIVNIDDRSFTSFVTFADNATDVKASITDNATAKFAVVVSTNAVFSNSVSVHGGLTVDAGKTATFNGTTSFSDGVTQNTGAQINVGAEGSLHLGGTVTFGGNAINVATGGTVNWDSAVVFDLDGLQAQESSGKYVYTLFSGADVNLSTLTVDNITLTDGKFGKNWIFGADGTISYTPSTAKVWTGGAEGDWDYSSANWNTTETFASGDSATFTDGIFGVNVAADIVAGVVTVAEDAIVALEAGEGGSLSAEALVVNGNLSTSVEIANLDNYTVAEEAGWAISGEQKLGNGTIDGMIYVAETGHVTVTATTPTDVLAGINNEGVVSVNLGGATAKIDMADSTGVLEVSNGKVNYLSNLGSQTLKMGSGTTLHFGYNAGTKDDAVFSNNIVLDGDATVEVYGNSQHSSVTISGDVEGAHTLTKADGNQNLTFSGKVDIAGLTTASNGHGTIIFNGGEGSVGYIKTLDAVTIQFSAKEGAVNIYSFDTFNMSSDDNQTNATRWLVVDSGVTLNGTGNSRKYGSTIENSWGVNGGGLKIDGTLNTEGIIAMDAGATTAYIKGSGLINTKGLDLCNNTKTYIQDGITINITSDTGIYKRNNDAEVHLKDATLKATTVDWSLKDGGTGYKVTLDDTETGTTFDVAAERTITVANILGGDGKLVKAGEGTLILTKNNTYTGDTVVKGGTLQVNGSLSADSTISVEGDAILAGTGVDIANVSIAATKTATFKDGITTEEGVVFAKEGGVEVKNTSAEGGSSIQYGIDQAAAQVTADTMTVGNAVTQTEINNSLVVGVIVNNNTEGLLLNGNVANGVTLNAAAGDITMVGQTSNTLSVVDLTIAAGKTVELIDGDQTEGTITVTDTLTGGSATLLSNLTLKGGSTLNVAGGGDDKALTLGSMLTIDLTEGGLVNLDQTTIDALAGLQDGQRLDLIVAAEQTTLDYGGSYDGVSYDTLFARTEGLTDAYTVYANNGAFGVTKQGAVPEPTTGTLSLLALMALAARRRRK